MQQANPNLELSDKELSRVFGGAALGRTQSKPQDAGTVTLAQDESGLSIGESTPLDDPDHGTSSGGSPASRRARSFRL